MMPSPPPLRAALRRAAVLALMLAAIAPRPAGADEAAMREATALADLTASEATMAPVLALMRERLITILTAAGAPSVDEAGKIVDTLPRHPSRRCSSGAFRHLRGERRG